RARQPWGNSTVCAILWKPFVQELRNRAPGSTHRGHSGADSMSRTGKRRWIVFIILLLLAAAAVAGLSFPSTLFPRDNKSLNGDDLDLRVGKAEVADVQLAGSEVGTIEPVVKVDVKSTLSGTVRQILVREGDRVHPGQTLARVEPDVNQAKTLSAVKSQLA